MRNALMTLVAVGVIGMLPAMASAGDRFRGYDRGSRYSGYHHGGGSRSSFGFSIGFGSRSWCGPGSYTSFSYSRGGSYCPPTYCPPVRTYCAPVVRDYCPPRVIYSAPPVVYVPPPAVVVAPPVVYSAPAPAYYSTPTYYYTSGTYYYGR